MLMHKDRNKENFDKLKQVVEEKQINLMYQEAKKKVQNLKVMRTYNNMGARFKNEIEELNDVPKQANDKTIVFSGYTGPSFLIDFERKIIIIIMCNHLRRTTLTRIERKRTTDQIIEDIYDQMVF